MYLYAAAQCPNILYATARLESCRYSTQWDQLVYQEHRPRKPALSLDAPLTGQSACTRLKGRARLTAQSKGTVKDAEVESS